MILKNAIAHPIRVTGTAKLINAARKRDTNKLDTTSKQYIMRTVNGERTV